jgi:hypothetical protein
MTDKMHPIISAPCRWPTVARTPQFLRMATLLGVSAVAYGLAGLPLPAMAQTAAPKKGGVIRIGMRVQDLKLTHYSWIKPMPPARSSTT